ncbi:hypothetical protein PT974_04021 [Cladobotryum mycophilum]|uniref:Uncharacterized protein n=1 Tax=Cladobotryum mycophilum TaxID=491253 RepID=A0ABR0STW6_9HYPO
MSDPCHDTESKETRTVKIVVIWQRFGFPQMAKAYTEDRRDHSAPLGSAGPRLLEDGLKARTNAVEMNGPG